MNSKSNDFSIVVKDLSVEYTASKYNYNSFKEYIIQGFRRGNSHKKIQALENVSFSVEKGTSLALVGHNGSGKSTLLKVLAGVIVPEDGEVEVSGRVAPLIELGAGFDGELSGVENIRLSCMLMGLTAREVTEKMQSIIEFSELREFIDIPVKNYSSGMFAKLGFACATAIDPDILLVDEVLAVGDANFSKKCLYRIRELQKKGTTIVLVSHDPNSVMSFCDKALVFSEGHLLFDGDVQSGLMKQQDIMEERYLLSLPDKGKDEIIRVRTLRANVEKQSQESERLRPDIIPNCICVQNGSYGFSIDVTKPFSIVFELKIKNPSLFEKKVSIGLGLNSINGARLGGCNNIQFGKELVFNSENADKSEVCLAAEFVFSDGISYLCSGEYEIILGVHDNGITRNIFTGLVSKITLVNPKYDPNVDGDIVYLPPSLKDVIFRFESELEKDLKKDLK